MVKIMVARHAGFCSGVRRAIEVTNSLLSKDTRTVSVLGPLIHNTQVMDKLYQSGLQQIEPGLEIRTNTVVIPTHSLPQSTIDLLTSLPIEVVDATCVFVKRAKNLVRNLARQVDYIFLLGDAQHPEVKSLISCASDKVIPVNNSEIVNLKVPATGKIAVISQTTQTNENFTRLVEYIRRQGHNPIVYNTICATTSKRQDEVKQLSSTVDLMLVLGGRHSANTVRLYETCRYILRRTYHIESPAEILPQWLKGVKCVGIAAGASTPDWIIQDTVTKIKQLAV